MPAPIDIPPGTRYNRWKVLSRVPNNKWGNRRFLCRCECGTEREVNGISLRSGISQSCGCLTREVNRQRMVTRYHTKESEELFQRGLKNCTDPMCVQDNPQLLNAFPKDVRKSNGTYGACKVCTGFRVMRSLYGITQDEYWTMHEAQKGVCAICERPQEGSTRTTRLDVDHCHDTGMVRALLCHACNKGLGFFKDNPERLQQAVDYLKTHT